jgi:hypothetical protein
MQGTERLAAAGVDELALLRNIEAVVSEKKLQRSTQALTTTAGPGARPEAEADEVGQGALGNSLSQLDPVMSPRPYVTQVDPYGACDDQGLRENGAAPSATSSSPLVPHEWVQQEPSTVKEVVPEPPTSPPPHTQDVQDIHEATGEETK